MPDSHQSGANIRPLFKRPESVLVIVYTVQLDVLLLCRQYPAGFWQSVTGSLHVNELPEQAAQRELHEETGICIDVMDHGISSVYPIWQAWRKRYAPGVTENREHEFSVQLPGRCAITLNQFEHNGYEWLPIKEAMAKMYSPSNRAALQRILKAEG